VEYEYGSLMKWRKRMAEIQETVREDGVIQVALIGKLDVRGLHAVDMRFHASTAARRQPTLVDLSQLEFIASLGVGMLISCARSMARFGAKMVLVNPQPLVEQVLVTVGVHEVIPIVRSIDEGLRTLRREA
jgi:anti-anti-sigma factor